MISMKYVSFVGVVNGKRTEGHKTREGVEKEVIELMKKKMQMDILFKRI